MTVAETEQALLEELAVFPDPQERLAHLMRRSGRGAVLPPAERESEALVPGCVSRVWLTASLDGGRCRFRVAADSPMVLGLVRLLCDVYDGATPEDVVATESDIFSRSGLDRHLSPTRRQGLAHARARVRALAAAWLE
jgi:cysteine desulfuration protein SufE